MHVRRKLILASGSLRRRELLHAAGIQFEVYPADIPEAPLPGEPPIQCALRLARTKAEKIAGRFPGEFVLGADTIVVVGEDLLGKPSDVQDAARMLRMLSGRAHQVTTAVSLIAPGRPADTRRLTTEVRFRSLREDEILEYIAGGEPMDKAGAYAIQGGAAAWVVGLKGDHSNVVGLPMSLVSDMLRTAGFLQT
jgi:septum formation protein